MNQEKTQYYRWQFLRLNEDYRKGYDYFIHFCNKFEKESPEKVDDFRLATESKFLDEFSINGIFDYQNQDPAADLFIYGIVDFAVQKGSIDQVYENRLEENQKIIGHYLVEHVWKKDFDKTTGQEKDALCSIPKSVQVVINYDAGIGDIHAEIERIVESIKKERKFILGVKRTRKQAQGVEESVIDYETYLEVYKLRTEEKLMNVDVAQIVYPKQDKKLREDKTSKHLRRARQLINGDFRKIIL